MNVVAHGINVFTILSLYIWNSFTSAIIIEDCVDVLPDCSHYGVASCGGPFVSWAKHNCPNFCNYCNGTQAPPPECTDVADDCGTFLPSACHDPQYSTWARESCRYTCRLCPDCVDKIDCKPYDKSNCGGNYLFWAQSNCPAYCGFCTPPPTPRRPCHDILPNCDMYVSDICTGTIFRHWTKENCRKFCQQC